MSFLKDFLNRFSDTLALDANPPNFAAMRDVGQIAQLFPWIQSFDSDTSSDAANTIYRLLKEEIYQKDKANFHDLRFIDLKVNDLARFKKFGPTTQDSLYCIASVNANGYVREKAILHLTQVRREVPFLFLLYRLADWVPRVQQLAERAIRRNIPYQPLSFFIQNHKTIDWLLKVKRNDLKDIHQEIVDFVCLDRNIAVITKKIAGYTTAEKSFLFKHLMAREKLNDDLFEKMMSDKSPLIRLLAIRNIDLYTQPEILKRCLNDTNQKIRNYAIHKIPAANIGSFERELTLLLFDNSATIRAIARKSLSQIMDRDFLSIYRAEVGHKPSLGAIVGLSEVGSTAELDTLTGFLTSKSAKLRAASLYAIANLDYQKAKAYAFMLLGDSSNSVKKICGTIIPKEKATDDLITLRELYDNGTNETKLFILKVINQYGGWDIVGDLLKGIEEADPKLNQLACTFLNSWYYYSIRLARRMEAADRRYVMNIYKNMNIEKTFLPPEIQKVLQEIPFIFGRK